MSRLSGAILALFAITPLLGQRTSVERVSWNKPIQPFHIVGNVYYVGVQGVSAFLITTPAGNILLDGGFQESAPLIEKSISDLGFRLTDVKFLLNSHAHFDHCGGLTALKERSGASMIASARDLATNESSRELNCVDKDRPFSPVKVDRVIADNDTVALGGVTLTAHLTPGHTKGCTTWTMPATVDGKTYQVVFYCSTTVVDTWVNNPDYPTIVSDYQQTFAKLRLLPCDVFLGPHGSFFNRDEKLAAIQKGRKNAFIDPKEFRKYVMQSEREFRKELAQQKAK